MEEAKTTVSIGELDNLRDFTVDEVFADGHSDGFTVLLGNFGEPDRQGLVKVRFQPTLFNENGPVLNKDIVDLTLSAHSGAEYAYYEAIGSPQTLWDNGLFVKSNVEITYPASSKQIRKARVVPLEQFVETSDLYERVVQPYIDQTISSGALQWMDNVLNGENEAERTVLRDEDPETGFLLSINPKWSSHPDPLKVSREHWGHPDAVKSLNLLCMVLRRDLRTLRDLGQQHLPLLLNMRSKCLQAIKEVYGLNRRQVRFFVHYQPQFYHFHLHIRSLYNSIGANVDRAHQLDDIIYNITNDGDYYAKKPLVINLQTNNQLYQALIDAQTPPEASSE